MEARPSGEHSALFPPTRERRIDDGRVSMLLSTIVVRTGFFRGDNIRIPLFFGAAEQQGENEKQIKHTRRKTQNNN
jgi:hypothetical protein